MHNHQSLHNIPGRAELYELENYAFYSKIYNPASVYCQVFSYVYTR